MASNYRKGASLFISISVGILRFIVLTLMVSKLQGHIKISETKEFFQVVIYSVNS